MNKRSIVTTILTVICIVGAAFAISDRYISKATFAEFQKHVIFRFDSLDDKLDLILGEQK